MDNNIEYRTLDISECEIREMTDDGKAPVISGYAAVFNSDSRQMMDKDRGIYIERISPGAFKYTDVVALVDHDRSRPLARYIEGRENNDLKLVQNERGLKFSFTRPDTSAGRDLSVLIKNRVYNKSSFAFVIPKGGDSWSRRGKNLYRTVTEAIVRDVSPCISPAYAKTTVNTRSFDEFISEERASYKIKLNDMRQELAAADDE